MMCIVGFTNNFWQILGYKDDILLKEVMALCKKTRRGVIHVAVHNNCNWMRLFLAFPVFLNHNPEILLIITLKIFYSWRISDFELFAKQETFF